MVAIQTSRHDLALSELAPCAYLAFGVVHLSLCLFQIACIFYCRGYRSLFRLGDDDTRADSLRELPFLALSPGILIVPLLRIRGIGVDARQRKLFFC